MLLLQAQPTGTTSQFLKVVSEMSKSSGMWDSLVIPIAILVFFSLIKYVSGRIMNTHIWFDFAAETAIDILTVFVAFIIGRYFLTTTSQDVLISSTGKIAIIGVVAIILSLIRVGVNGYMLRSKPALLKAGGLLFLEYFLSVCCIIMIFKF